MKWLALVLLLLLLLLQYRLWFAEGSLVELHRLEAQVERQRQVNDTLRERNRQLEQEVLDLQGGMDAVEERAREDLGMIRKGETYSQIVGPTDGKPAQPPEEAADESAGDPVDQPADNPPAAEARNE